MDEARPLRIRQPSEQNFTSSHTFSHFFRHVKGRPQTTQTLVGRSDFRRIFGMTQVQFLKREPVVSRKRGAAIGSDFIGARRDRETIG